MPKFIVSIDRLERIRFEVEAVDEHEAVERYLDEGEEIGARTLDLHVVSVESTALDVWLRIPDGEEESEAEANTFPEGDRFRVDWYLTAVGQITSRSFDTLDEAHDWLRSEGFVDYSSGEVTREQAQ